MGKTEGLLLELTSPRLATLPAGRRYLRNAGSSAFLANRSAKLLEHGCRGEVSLLFGTQLEPGTGPALISNSVEGYGLGGMEVRPK